MKSKFDDIYNKIIKEGRLMTWNSRTRRYEPEQDDDDDLGSFDGYDPDLEKVRQGRMSENEYRDELRFRAAPDIPRDDTHPMMRRKDEDFPKTTFKKTCPVCGKENEIVAPAFGKCLPTAEAINRHMNWFKKLSEAEKENYRNGTCLTCFGKKAEEDADK